MCEWACSAFSIIGVLDCTVSERRRLPDVDVAAEVSLEGMGNEFCRIANGRVML